MLLTSSASRHAGLACLTFGIRSETGRQDAYRGTLHFNHTWFAPVSNVCLKRILDSHQRQSGTAPFRTIKHSPSQRLSACHTNGTQAANQLSVCCLSPPQRSANSARLVRPPASQPAVHRKLLPSSAGTAQTRCQSCAQQLCESPDRVPPRTSGLDGRNPILRPPQPRKPVSAQAIDRQIAQTAQEQNALSRPGAGSPNRKKRRGGSSMAPYGGGACASQSQPSSSYEVSQSRRWSRHARPTLASPRRGKCLPFASSLFYFVSSPSLPALLF